MNCVKYSTVIEKEGSPTYHVGDIVRVVDKPYMRCPFEWINWMDKYCGREVKILKAYWNDRYKTYVYKIGTVDGVERSVCAFCVNCFVAEPEEPEQECLGVCAENILELL